MYVVVRRGFPVEHALRGARTDASLARVRRVQVFVACALFAGCYLSHERGVSPTDAVAQRVDASGLPLGPLVPLPRVRRRQQDRRDRRAQRRADRVAREPDR